MALEGALKLKEMTLIHAEGYAAGEMKHGPLAMIDENFPTFAVATDSPMFEKTCSNIEEIKARKGPVVAVATEGNKDIKRLDDDVIYIPRSHGASATDPAPPSSCNSFRTISPSEAGSKLTAPATSPNL